MEIVIEDLKYSLNTTEQTAEVRYHEYRGAIVIPTTIVTDGLKYSVTSIGDYAFHGCTGLTSITIPSSVTSIGHFAFSECRRLTSIEIPNSVTSIGAAAFYGLRQFE